MPGAALYEIVRVGSRRLLGEVIRVNGDVATVQVFEDTTGLALEEPVEATGAPLLAELGPGLLGSVLDGTGRPLHRLAASEGNFLGAGTVAPTLDPEARWALHARGESRRPAVSRRRARHGRGEGRHPAPHPGAAGRGGGVGLARRRELHRGGGDWPAGRRHAAHVAPALAGAPAPARGALASRRSSLRDGAAGLRLPLSGGGRRVGGGARRIRHRQDRHRAVAGQVRRRRHRGVRGVRRARQRDGGRAGGIPGAGGSAHRALADGPHGARGQHLEHAGGGARSLGLPGAHDRRVLPRHGLPGGADGRLALALGRGAARDRLPASAKCRARRATRPRSATGSASCASGRGARCRSARRRARAR